MHDESIISRIQMEGGISLHYNIPVDTHNNIMGILKSVYGDASRASLVDRILPIS